MLSQTSDALKGIFQFSVYDDAGLERNEKSS